MPSRRTNLTVGLLLIVVSFLLIFGSGYLIPAPAPCHSAACMDDENIGAAIELLALPMLIIGILVQASNLARWRAQERESPPLPTVAPGGGFAPGIVGPGTPLSPPPPFPGPAPAYPRSPPAGAPSTVKCPRCPGVYPTGQYAYCPACGSPLPFAP